jgi:hypothetical protein
MAEEALERNERQNNMDSSTRITFRAPNAVFGHKSGRIIGKQSQTLCFSLSNRLRMRVFVKEAATLYYPSPEEVRCPIDSK